MCGIFVGPYCMLVGMGQSRDRAGGRAGVGREGHKKDHTELLQKKFGITRCGSDWGGRL